MNKYIIVHACTRESNTNTHACIFQITCIVSLSPYTDVCQPGRVHAEDPLVRFMKGTDLIFQFCVRDLT